MYLWDWDLPLSRILNTGSLWELVNYAPTKVGGLYFKKLLHYVTQRVTLFIEQLNKEIFRAGCDSPLAVKIQVRDPWLRSPAEPV